MNPHGKLIYLASPYSSPDKTLEAFRFHRAVEATAWLMTNLGVMILSPIVGTHPVLTAHKLPGDWKFWAEYDEVMLSRCDELWILCEPGFSISIGTNAEKKLGEKYGLPIRYVKRMTHISATDGINYLYTLHDVPPEDSSVPV